MAEISIIVPIYNVEKYINKCIDSILVQTFSDFELILVDDGSTDKSGVISNEYVKKDTRVKVIHKQTGGLSSARNEGIENASGKYIAFIDSDDLWKSDKLEKQVNFMEQNKIVFSYSSYEMMNEDGEKLDKIIKCKDVITYKDLLRYNKIGCLTVMIDISVIKNLQMEYINHEDYATWLKILKQGYNAYGIDKSLALYRKRDDSLSGNKLKAAKWTWNIIRNVEKTPLLKSIFYFNIYTFINIKKHIMK